MSIHSKCISHSVVSDETGCHSQVNDWGGFGAAAGKGVHMCHHIVSPLLLLLCCQFKIYICEVGLHFLKLFICDRQS